MLESLLELLPEFVSVLFFAGGAAALSTLGVYIEQLAFETLATGETVLALWLAVIGLMAFYFGPYLMGFTEALPRSRRLLAHLTE
ncbi:hypothetical protein AUR64_00535 [Haloprofundus marisrubri]|uniref:DUF8151 domain-containing protein n=1 Tax=Haloprofundus marisrubri TaxID=1514971 RepID=A0A0W1R459_9EURY|nr:hypothetical protein [Haloprofundus marisrubri]KTG08099.1 hypothetical protein AUR64_00535 [Haloprofundus marisrubri]